MNKLTGSVFCMFCGMDLPVELPIAHASTYTDGIYITTAKGAASGGGLQIQIKHQCEGNDNG